MQQTLSERPLRIGRLVGGVAVGVSVVRALLATGLAQGAALGLGIAGIAVAAWIVRTGLATIPEPRGKALQGATRDAP